MALSPAGDMLYVTNANGDTISAISTANDTIVKTLRVSGASDRGDVAALGMQLASLIDGPIRYDLIPPQDPAAKPAGEPQSPWAFEPAIFSGPTSALAGAELFTCRAAR